MLALLMLVLTAPPGVSRPPPLEPSTILNFVREGKTWLEPQLLCTDHAETSAHGLSYLLASAVAEGPTELRFQDRSDGEITRHVSLGEASSSPTSSDEGELDRVSRPIVGSKERVAINLMRPNKKPPWAWSANIFTESASTGRGPPATDPILGHGLECPGGPLLMRCAAPGWDIRVQQTSGSSGPQLSYYAWHGPPAPALVIDVPWANATSAISWNKAKYVARFEHERFIYEFSVSADPATPGAQVAVLHGGHIELQISCTAYSIDPGQIDAAWRAVPPP